MPPKAHHPWDDKSLSPDQRADLVIKEMTLDEKIQLVHGTGWGALREGASDSAAVQSAARATCRASTRLGIPDINHGRFRGGRAAWRRGTAATRRCCPRRWARRQAGIPKARILYGSVIGRELRAQGYNMSIGGGVDLTREPRNGRNFEYAGEDPVLAGTMIGQLDEGRAGPAGDGRHQALRLQRSGDRPQHRQRGAGQAQRCARRDLLAFEIAIGDCRARRA